MRLLGRWWLTFLSRNRGQKDSHQYKVRLGKWGESKARWYLWRRGYRLVCRNFSTGGGEVDLIMRDRHTIVFVEVKTRTSEEFAHGESAVNYGKQKRIELAAKEFIRKRDLREFPCRFDVVVVVKPVKGKIIIKHHENAFKIKY